MSIICKTGCGQQVDYENIEFTDGFVYTVPHNLDQSIHYCPIFHDQSSLFSNPGGSHPFDSNPNRENSYGDEIMKIDSIFFEFDKLILSKKQNLSLDDITIYKTRLQSFLNIYPLIGLYTDSLDGFSDLDEEEFESALETGVLNDKHKNGEGVSVYNTLGSSPLTALKKIYYILEGDSINFQKCKQLEKEILDNSPDNNYNFYKANPHEMQLIEAKKQLDHFENILEKNSENKEIQESVKFYHALIYGIKDWENLPKYHGAASMGIKDHVLSWYQDKEYYLKGEKSKMKRHPEITLEQELMKTYGVEIVDVTTDGLFDLKKIHKLIYKNTTNDVESLLDEISGDESELKELTSKKHSETSKYNYNYHFNNNTQVHISNVELHLRQMIISSLYDNDVNFMKNFFKQIWDEMDNRKSKQNKKISSPKEKTELDYADMGNLLTILQNRETKKRAKSKNMVQFDDFISKIGIIMDYRNQLAHNRGLIDGDLEKTSKMICVGLCNEIDTFCVNVLYR